MNRLILILAFCASLSACASAPSHTWVRIRDSEGTGTALVTSSTGILTVEHCAQGPVVVYQRGLKFKTRVVEVLERLPENLVRLEVLNGHLNGPYPEFMQVRFGDSGTPITNKYGDVIGLLSMAGGIILAAPVEPGLE